MKRKFSMTLGLAIMLATFTGLAWAQSNIVTSQSKSDFEQTVAQIKSATSKSGLMVMGNLNQGRMLSMTGLNLKAESFLVGNPSVGKKLFSADPGVGLYVPVRIFVYEGSDGHTYVRYEKPSAGLGQLNNPQINMIAKMLDEKIQSIAQAATE